MTAMNPVLAHRLGLAQIEMDPAGVQDAPTLLRQMRRALGQAADKGLGLSATVADLAVDDLDAEAVIDTGPDGWIVLGLRDGTHTGLSGLFLMDLQMRSAVIEMLTMGMLFAPQPDQRPVTRRDAVMAMPFADRMLKDLAEVGFCAGQFDLAGYDMGPMADLRTAGLVMTQGQYRRWRMIVQMGGGTRQGEMMIALRPDVAPDDKGPSKRPDWRAALRATLQQAPVDLDAVLTRIALSIQRIEGFEIGQIIPLAGVTVGSVTLTGPGGETIAQARLGQIAGKRAVRVEPEVVELQEDMLGIKARPPPPKADTPAAGLIAD